jgi:hypothetical protein
MDEAMARLEALDLPKESLLVHPFDDGRGQGEQFHQKAPRGQPSEKEIRHP